MVELGRKAPSFSLSDDAGQTVTSAGLRGAPYVLYFYPRDSTPGCTTEAMEFSALSADFAALGVAVFGVSKDSVASHAKFRERKSLTVRLLSDPDLALHRAYGAWGEKVSAGVRTEGVLRSTFLIGADGAVLFAWPKVSVKGHANQVFERAKAGVSSK